MRQPLGLRPERVEPVRLEELESALVDARPGAGRVLHPAPAPDDRPVLVTGVTHDSRQVRAGDLYAALPGQRVHGAAFVGQAAAAGAVAVLTDPAGALSAAAAGLPALVVADPRSVLGQQAALVFGHPARQLLLIGITGTNGKTTTCYLLDAILRRDGHRTGLVGTVETRVGDERVPSARTTPEAPELHALFAVMRERGITACTMEVSSHAMVLGRVDGVVFDVAIFTNLSQDHLDFHGTFEEYFAAKASLFTPDRARRAVILVDDIWGARIAQSCAVAHSTVRTRPVSEPDDCDWWVETSRPDPTGAGSTFRLRSADGADLTAQVPLPGDYNVSNAAAAAVAAVVAAVPPDVVASGLAASSGVPGRMERIDPAPDSEPEWQAGGDPLVIVDYAHTPDAIAAALAALRPLRAGRLAVVLGAGGDRDRGKRPGMGAAASQGADLVVVTDDNPRSEDPATIRAAVLAGARAVSSAAKLLEIADRGEAIRQAVLGSGADDIVLVAGKGHEQGQEVGGQVAPFDDRGVARAALGERRAAPAGRLARSAASGHGGRERVAAAPDPSERESSIEPLR